MENFTEKPKEITAKSLFVRSLIITIAAVFLILIGYFSAGYFFGS